MTEPAAETSVIVRAYNEEAHLPALFDALETQAYRDFEVVLVDSGSLDRSRDIAQARGAKVLRIDSHDFTFGYSLNVGVGAGAGRFMAIVSAHTVPRDASWLETLVRSLRDDGTAMAYGRQLGVARSKFGEAEDFRRTFGPRRLMLEPPDFFANNANAALRRDLWEAYPFDEELTGLEDIDWAKHWMEKGYRVVYEPEAALYHIHEESWQQVRRRYYREAVAARRIGIKGRRRVPAECLRELGHAVADLGRALRPQDNPVAQRLGVAGRLAESVVFRSNKTWGIVRGLMAPHPMETAEERQDMLFDRSAEAVVVEAPGKAALRAVPVPQVKPGEVLIRVAKVAVCATDLEIFNGTLGYFENGLGQYPIVPGHEFSGRVVAAGSNVAGLAEGDPVVVECIQGCGVCERCRAGNAIGCAERTELGVLRRDGAYARFVVVPARFVHRLPRGLGLDKAALVEPLAVVLKGLGRLAPALAAAGDEARCAVVGAGPLGHICAKVLAARGHAVTAFDRSSDRLAFLDPGAVETSSRLDQVAACDVIVEATGDAQALETTIAASPAGAAILLLGLPYGARPFSFEAIAAYDKTVVGSVGSSADDFAAAIELLPSLDLDAHLGTRMPLADFARAWETSRQGDVLKVILDVE